MQYEQDRALSERAVADTEYLAREVAAMRVALGEVATRDYLRGELQRLLEDLGAARHRTRRRRRTDGEARPGGREPTEPDCRDIHSDQFEELLRLAQQWPRTYP